jgi:hypothetical protein
MRKQRSSPRSQPAVRPAGLAPTAVTLTAIALAAALAGAPAAAEIRRDPVGVNVNAHGASSAFITFGGLRRQVPVEAAWCGRLVPASPDRGMKCDPATLFGVLPLRFDHSRLSTDGSAFTDVMTIPPSVARRAYQAAVDGDAPSFFYVRRFSDQTGGPDEYVFVTCRLTAGGARSPLALLDVQLRFAGEPTVLQVERGAAPPRFEALITYNGSGRLRGRWEVVLPGDAPPSSRDLLTEGTLPPEERPLQRRYTELARFNVFLPPIGTLTLEGPEPELLPTDADGLHEILLRIEVSQDREASSDLEAAGAGTGVVHAGGIAGFPLPVLRYYVGSVPSAGGAFAPIEPADGATLDPQRPLDVRWERHPGAMLYRVDLTDGAGAPLFGAALQQGIGGYRLPPWVNQQSTDGRLRWRVVALGPDARELAATPWRVLLQAPASAEQRAAQR